MSRPGAPVPHDEASRLRTLQASGLIDAAVCARIDRYTRIARALTGAPIAVVGLVDRDHVHIKAGRDEFGAGSVPRNISFCAHAILNDEPLVVADTLHDPRFATSPLVTDAPGVRSYAGVPLLADDHSRIGTLAVMDTRPGTPDSAALKGLTDLADLLSGELAGHRHGTVDADTGLPNRAGFEATAAQTLATVQRLNRPSTLVVAGINEARERGQTIGADEVREAAALLQGTFRDTDIYGRIREDKLCVLLTGAGAVDAVACLKRLESALSARNAVAGARQALALRFGISTARPSEHQSLQEMLAEAQTSLEAGSWVKHGANRQRSVLPR